MTAKRIDHSWESESPGKKKSVSSKTTDPGLPLEIIFSEEIPIHDKAWLAAIAHLRKWRTRRINQLLADIQTRKISIEAFFNLGEEDWASEFGLDAKQCDGLFAAQSQLLLTSDIVERMEQAGFEILSQKSAEYPRRLIQNLGKAAAPPVLYLGGDLELLNQPSIAVVGSRKASENALAFTEYIAQRAVEQDQIVVSGFAKGVDRKALDSTLDAGGKSVIVLPQGVMTCGNSLVKYQDAVSTGKALVFSTFHPKTPWRVGAAMRRNAFVYGLADEIYIAESGDSGGTWSGAIDGLRKKRQIFVRQPNVNEKNANAKLIARGATAIGYDGQITKSSAPKQTDLFDETGI